MMNVWDLVRHRYMSPQTTLLRIPSRTPASGATSRPPTPAWRWRSRLLELEPLGCPPAAPPPPTTQSDCMSSGSSLYPPSPSQRSPWRRRPHTRWWWAGRTSPSLWCPWTCSNTPRRTAIVPREPGLSHTESCRADWASPLQCSSCGQPPPLPVLVGQPESLFCFFQCPVVHDRQYQKRWTFWTEVEALGWTWTQSAPSLSYLLDKLCPPTLKMLPAPLLTLSPFTTGALPWKHRATTSYPGLGVWSFCPEGIHFILYNGLSLGGIHAFRKHYQSLFLAHTKYTSGNLKWFQIDILYVLLVLVVLKWNRSW